MGIILKQKKIDPSKSWRRRAKNKIKGLKDVFKWSLVKRKNKKKEKPIKLRRKQKKLERIAEKEYKKSTIITPNYDKPSQSKLGALKVGYFQISYRSRSKQIGANKIS